MSANPEPNDQQKESEKKTGLSKNNRLFLLFLAIAGIAAIPYASRPHKCIAKIKSQMRDPSSLRIISIKKINDFTKEIDMTSLNGLGGRVRDTVTCFPSTGGILY